MSDKLAIVTIAALIVGAGIGYFAFDRWVMQTGGRSGSALAIADACAIWAHADDAARARADAATVRNCESYYRTRSAIEANDDEDRWRRRNMR